MSNGAKALSFLVLASIVLAPCLASTLEEEEHIREIAQPADETVTPARVIAKTQKAPEYPPAALAARFDGKVLVTLSILPDGKIGDVKVTESDHPNVGFEDATLKAVKQWEFTPATKDGKPVEYETSYRLSFRLEGGGRGGRVDILAATGNAESDQNRQADAWKMRPPVPPTSAGKR